MRVSLDVTNPLTREHTMTKVQGKGEVIDIKAVLADDADFLRRAMKAAQPRSQAGTRKRHSAEQGNIRPHTQPRFCTH